MPILEDLGCPFYLVTSNGARIHSPASELLYSFDIKSDAIKSILDLDIHPDFTTVLFKEKVWQSNKENEKLNSFQTEMNYPNEIVDFIDQQMIEQMFTKILRLCVDQINRLRAFALSSFYQILYFNLE